MACLAILLGLRVILLAWLAWLAFLLCSLGFAACLLDFACLAWLAWLIFSAGLLAGWRACFAWLACLENVLGLLGLPCLACLRYVAKFARVLALRGLFAWLDRLTFSLGLLAWLAWFAGLA